MALTLKGGGKCGFSSINPEVEDFPFGITGLWSGTRMGILEQRN